MPDSSSRRAGRPTCRPCSISRHPARRTPARLAEPRAALVAAARPCFTHPVALVTDLDTPAVTVRLDIVERNIRRVHDHLARHGIANRPHVKTHKIPALGRMQMAAGAQGITCQKLGEVEVFTEAGVADDVLLTFNVLGRAKSERLLALARRLERLAVVSDKEVVARGLGEAARAAGTEIPFLVECDTGFGRNGVQTPEAALELARTAMRLGGLRFEGLMTFPNREPGTRQFLERALELFKRAGVPVPVVSGGGTPAIFAAQNIPQLTEHRAGTYIYNDRMVVASGTATWDDCAMRVRCTVVSTPTRDRAILDAGTNEARNHGLRVLGCYDGFKWLVQGDTQHVVDLEINDTSRIHFDGGSIIRTSRTNPSKSAEAIRQVGDALQRLGVNHLITIGGDDTAYSASRLAKTVPGLTVAHVPKTIDNDLPLPRDIVTFGFPTACNLGKELVRNLMQDAQTTERWFFITVMGRHAGHLALGIGGSAAATLTLIAEEFPQPQISLDRPADTPEGAIIKRRAQGREHGVASLSAGPRGQLHLRTP